MRRSRFTEEQIIGILKEHEAGVPVSDLCRKTPSAFASTFHPPRDQTLRIMNGSASAPPLKTPDSANPTARTNSPMDRRWGHVTS
jgi:hypothetical protein